MLQMMNPFSASWKATRKARLTVTDSNAKVRCASLVKSWGIVQQPPQACSDTIVLLPIWYGNSHFLRNTTDHGCRGMWNHNKSCFRSIPTVFKFVLQGEGMIPGGLLVIKPGNGGVVLSHVEKFFGDLAPIADVRFVVPPTISAAAMCLYDLQFAGLHCVNSFRSVPATYCRLVLTCISRCFGNQSKVHIIFADLGCCKEGSPTVALQTNEVEIHDHLMNPSHA